MFILLCIVVIQLVGIHRELQHIRAGKHIPLDASDGITAAVGLLVGVIVGVVAICYALGAS